MRGTVHRLVVLSGLTAALASADCASDRASRLLGPTARSSILVETDTTPIPVTTTWYWIGPGETYVYSATPADSSVPVSYSWVVTSCPGNVADIDCNWSVTRKYTGRTPTITLPKYNSGSKVSIAVEVKQLVSGGNSGTAKDYRIVPPPPGYGSISGSFICDLGKNYFWQVEHWDTSTGTFVPDSVVIPPDSVGAGTKVAQLYRRNPCNGVKQTNYKK